MKAKKRKRIKPRIPMDGVLKLRRGGVHSSKRSRKREVEALKVADNEIWEYKKGRLEE